MTTPIVFDVQGADIRFGTTEGGTPYSIASDFAKSMGYRDAANALRILDGDEKGTQTVSTPGGPQQMKVIYEDGMWELIFRSTLPGAKAIKSRVKAILREIRETGRYDAAPREMTKLEALQAAIESEQARLAAEARVAKLEPAARSWQVLASGEGDFAVADAAKILGRNPSITLGRNRLFALLAEYRWTYRQGADDKPRAMQSAVERGWLSELPQSYEHPHTGDLILAAPQVRVTVKGMHELHKRLGGTAPVQVPTNSTPGGAA
jgi:prophage antirepressor-like protein